MLCQWRQRRKSDFFLSNSRELRVLSRHVDEPKQRWPKPSHWFYWLEITIYETEINIVARVPFQSWFDYYSNKWRKWKIKLFKINFCPAMSWQDGRMTVWHLIHWFVANLIPDTGFGSLFNALVRFSCHKIVMASFRMTKILRPF